MKLPNEAPSWIQQGELVDGSILGDSSGVSNRPALGLFENQQALNIGKSDLHTAQTLFIDPAGSDITGEGTLALPYATPQRALEDLTGDVDRNSQVVIDCAVGVYPMSVPLSLDGFNKGTLLIRGKDSVTPKTPAVVFEFDVTGWVEGDLMANDSTMVDVNQSQVNFEYITIKPTVSGLVNSIECLTVRNHSTFNYMGLRLENGPAGNMLVQSRSHVRGYSDSNNYFYSSGATAVLLSESSFRAAAGSFQTTGGSYGIHASYNSSIDLALDSLRIENVSISGIYAQHNSFVSLAAYSAWAEDSVGGQCYIEGESGQPSIVMERGAYLLMTFVNPSDIAIANYAAYLPNGLCLHNDSTALLFGVRLHARPAGSQVIHAIQGSKLAMNHCRVEGGSHGAYAINGSNIYVSTTLIHSCTVGVYSAYSSAIQCVGIVLSGNSTNASPAFNTVGNYDSYNTGI